MIDHPRTMEEVYQNREELAVTANDEWLAANMRTIRSIVGHKDFRRLVREVAVAEQPWPRHYDYLRRNSLTYGTWMTRGAEVRRTGGYQRRARVLAAQIAAELGIWPHAPGDAQAVVYVTARDWVQSREIPA